MKRIFSTRNIMNDLFRKRVPMYTGEMTLKSIFLFIRTYRMALIEHDFIDTDKPDFHNFHDFVKDKFGFSESTAGWRRMIVAKTLGLNSNMDNWDWELLEEKEKKMTLEEHKASIELFFKLFDEFYDQT